MFFRSIISSLWLAWVLYWLISAVGNKTTARRESYAAGFRYRIPTAVGALLLFLPGRNPWMTLRFMPDLAIVDWLGVIFVVLGLGFTIWARVHLGSNWSGIVTVKKDHQLVRTGPYRWVRHPIYTGLLLALLGIALALGQWRGLIGFAFLVLAFVLKLRFEEQWMVETFGDEYARYKREVAALVPGVY
jgi:protein-S-isoprenylcysteine O-methyltransferase Ste14